MLQVFLSLEKLPPYEPLLLATVLDCFGRTSLFPSPISSPAIPNYRAEHDHAGSSSPAAGPDDLWTVRLSGHGILPPPGLLTGKTFH